MTDPRRSSEELPPYVQAASYRSADPIARSIVGQLRDASELDRRLVHEACANRLGLSSSAFAVDRRALAVRSLRAWQSRPSGKSSKPKYEKWRLGPDAPGWVMTASAIARAFDSWPEAVAAAWGTPTLDLIALRSMTQGPDCTREGLIRALQDAAAFYGRDWLIFSNYEAWARQDMETNPDKIHALSRNAFSKKGGFVKLMHDAGLRPVKSESTSHLTLPVEKEAPFTRSDGRAAVLAAQAELEEVVAAGTLALRGLQQKGVDDQRLTSKRYRILRAAGHTDLPDPWPSGSQMERLFGNWSSAIRDAGLLEGADLAEGVLRLKRAVDPDLALLQLRVILDGRGDITGARYQAICAAAPTPGGGERPLASLSWLKGKHGSFAEAKDRARALPPPTPAQLLQAHVADQALQSADERTPDA